MPGVAIIANGKVCVTQVDRHAPRLWLEDCDGWLLLEDGVTALRLED